MTALPHCPNLEENTALRAVVDLVQTWCDRSKFTLTGDGIGNEIARALSNLMEHCTRCHRNINSVSLEIPHQYVDTRLYANRQPGDSNLCIQCEKDDLDVEVPR